LIFGSISSRRCALSRSCVPSSSAPIRRENSPTHRRRGLRQGGGQGPFVARWVGWLNQAYPESPHRP
jgi:hypothetical protein